MKIKDMLQILVPVGLLVVFLVSTNPYDISLPFVLIPYLLAAYIFYKLARTLLNVLLSGIVGEAKIKLYSVIATAVIINFALLKSLGELTLQDGLISFAIAAVAIVYIGKFSLSS